MTEKTEKKKSSQKSGQGRSSTSGRHGSITKAGKVRNSTPKIAPTNMSKSPISRIRLRSKYLSNEYKKAHTATRQREVEDSV